MMRDIGKNIRDLRQQKHLTQEELAEQLFVTRQTVSNYENGRTRWIRSCGLRKFLIQTPTLSSMAHQCQKGEKTL